MTCRLTDRLAAELVTHAWHDWTDRQPGPLGDGSQVCARRGCAVIWWLEYPEPSVPCRGQDNTGEDG